jgi:hypothetical protein
VFTAWFSGGRLAMMGSPKAAVFPVPVWAWAIKSCFEPKI